MHQCAPRAAHDLTQHREIGADFDAELGAGECLAQHLLGAHQRGRQAFRVACLSREREADEDLGLLDPSLLDARLGQSTDAARDVACRWRPAERRDAVRRQVEQLLLPGIEGLDRADIR